MEMDWENFEKDQNYISTVLKIWQKNNCGGVEFLET